MPGTGSDATAPDLDVAIRQLLNQQADIQSRLSVLLAAQHGLEIPVELDMLRHKLRVLEDLVDRYGTLILFCSFKRLVLVIFVIRRIMSLNVLGYIGAKHLLSLCYDQCPARL